MHNCASSFPRGELSFVISWRFVASACNWIQNNSFNPPRAGSEVWDDDQDTLLCQNPIIQQLMRSYGPTQIHSPDTYDQGCCLQIKKMRGSLQWLRTKNEPRWHSIKHLNPILLHDHSLTNFDHQTQNPKFHHYRLLLSFAKVRNYTELGNGTYSHHLTKSDVIVFC